MAVGEGHTGQGPEGEHEASLFVVVPGGDDELLALCAGVGVGVVGKEGEHDLGSDIAVALVLAGSHSGRDSKENEPRDAYLDEHFDVEKAKEARVQLGAHEEVVDGIPSDAVLLSAGKGSDVLGNGHQVARDDGDGNQGAKLVNKGIQREEAGDVQCGHGGHGEVEARVGVAEVLELLATLVEQGLAPGFNAGESAVQDGLKDQVDPVDLEGAQTGESARVNEVSELGHELKQGLSFLGKRELSVIVCGTNPHVPHEHGEANHHAQGAK